MLWRTEEPNTLSEQLFPKISLIRVDGRDGIYFENKIMHAAFRIGDTDIMASDGRCSGQITHQGFSLSVTAKNEVHAQQLFTNLASGGQIQMPLTKTFFSLQFGMVADRFGISWMVIVDH